MKVTTILAALCAGPAAAAVIAERQGSSSTPAATATSSSSASPPAATGSGGSGSSSGGGSSAPYLACVPGIYSNAQCCATDALGVADLDCHNPSSVPTSSSNFQSTCAAGGQRARCCVLPVAGQDVLCQTPSGVKD